MTLQGKVDELKSLIRAGLSTKEDIAKLEEKVSQLELAHKAQQAPQAQLLDKLSESKELKTFVANGCSGEAVIHLDRKTVIAGLSSSTSGALQVGRLPTVAAEPRQPITIESVLASDVTTFSVVDYLKSTSAATPGAVVQTEGADLGENGMTFSTGTARIETVGCWIPISRQAAEDVRELAAFVQSTLMFYTNLGVEAELLAGSGSSPHLNGLVTQAQLLDLTLLPMSGYAMLDVVSCAIEQLAIAKEVTPTFVILNSVDWAKARRSKSSLGEYLYGEPSEPADTLFGLTVVPTTSMSAGTFLIGSSSAASAQVINRQDVQVELARSHASYFTANKIAIRALRRLALVVRRPNSLVYGSFASSPAA